MTTWSAFLRSQAEAILACDFLETVTLTGQRQYVLAVIEHVTRRVRVLGATAHPTADRVAQAARNLVMDVQDAGTEVRYLIQNRDGKYPPGFDAVLHDAGIQVVLPGVRMPWPHGLIAPSGAARRLARRLRRLPLHVRLRAISPRQPAPVESAPFGADHGEDLTKPVSEHQGSVTDRQNRGPHPAPCAIAQQPGPCLPGRPMPATYAVLEEASVVHVSASRVAMEQMPQAMTDHELRPVVDHVFPFAEAVDAYRAHHAVDFFGKLVIIIGEERQ